MSADTYEAWKMSRLGKATASRIADIIAETKKGWSTSRRKYMIELMAERLTGMPAKQFLSEAMLWGNTTEPDARRAYERHSGKSVEQVWFVDHPTISMSGASPDGYVGRDGLIEIKCPETATHLAYLLDGKINSDYITQMQWQMASTGRKWCDFVSYDPRIVDEGVRYSMLRVERDNIMIADLEKKVTEFLGELNAAMESLGVDSRSVATLPPPQAREGDSPAKVQTAPIDAARQIRPEDEDNWKVTPIEFKRKGA